MRTPRMAKPLVSPAEARCGDVNSYGFAVTTRCTAWAVKDGNKIVMLDLEEEVECDHHTKMLLRMTPDPSGS